MIRNLLREAYYTTKWQMEKFCDKDASAQMAQRSVMNQYRAGLTLPDIKEAGFRCYSQFEEDGILLYLLAKAGMKTKKVVELCAGFGAECMAANLIVNHGFQGFLFDGNQWNVKMARRFFASRKDSSFAPPTIRQSWITAENINDVLRDAGAAGGVDVLSLDIDGNDYWVWKAIEAIQPRLCVFETHSLIPSHLALTIPYRADFVAAPSDVFKSASLLAMTKLSKAKGYRLVGGHRYGFNAFFVRDDLGQDALPEVSVESVHAVASAQYAQAHEWPKYQHLPWVEV